MYVGNEHTFVNSHITFFKKLQDFHFCGEVFFKPANIYSRLIFSSMSLSLLRNSYLLRCIQVLPKQFLTILETLRHFGHF